MNEPRITKITVGGVEHTVAPGAEMDPGGPPPIEVNSVQVGSAPGEAAIFLKRAGDVVAYAVLTPDEAEALAHTLTEAARRARGKMAQLTSVAERSRNTPAKGDG